MQDVQRINRLWIVRESYARPLRPCDQERRMVRLVRSHKPEQVLQETQDSPTSSSSLGLDSLVRALARFICATLLRHNWELV